MSQEPSRRERKHQKPLTLQPLTFEQAVDRILLAKPNKPKKDAKQNKPPKE
jgi:hypothetical protein